MSAIELQPKKEVNGTNGVNGIAGHAQDEVEVKSGKKKKKKEKEPMIGTIELVIITLFFMHS